MAIAPFKVIQGHIFWYQRKARMRLPISENYADHILHCFQVIADYWSDLRFIDKGYLSLTHSFGVNP